MSPSIGCARLLTYAAVALVALVARVGYAQVAPAANGPMSVEELSQQFEQLQRELQVLRERDHERQAWEASIVDRLPDVDEDESEEDEAAEDGEDGDDADDLVKLLTPVTGDCGKITFKPGLRIQPRYIYDNLNDNHDFLIRRFRLKTGGNAYGLADYGLELKVDGTGRIDTDHTPDPVVENAWLDFPLHDVACLRIGLYDAPFSRNALTSDSKLLLMDRSLIFDELASFGLADNTIGMMLHARPLGGHLEYAVGIFDNIRFERFTGIPVVTKDSRDLMPAGRVVWHLLDPAGSTDGCLDCGYADYRASYIGQGRRLALGANVEQLSNCVDGAAEFDLFAWGVDLFFNSGPFVVEAEYDELTRNTAGAAPDVIGSGWYAQAGYLLNYHQYINCPCTWGWELAARYQELDRSDLVADDELQWTSVGMNVYIRDHNLKVQTDYTFKREEGVELNNDIFQVQLQFDY